jgi:hypothetical protein
VAPLERAIYWSVDEDCHLFNPWLKLAREAVQLGWEAQRVIALRLARLAAGGASARIESRRMVNEKAAAIAEAHAAIIGGAAIGRNGTTVAKKVLRIYRKRVKANRRRLSRR